MAVKSYALTTADRASSYMGIDTPTGTKLTVLEAIINSATEFIENYCGRRFKKTTHAQEEYTTERAESLNLKNFPIISSESFVLERRTSAQNEDAWETVDSQYYHIDYDSGIIYGASGLKFARTTNGYRVTYTAGYDFNNTSTFLSDTEGGDIELAAWMLIEALWNKRKGGAGIQSERIGDYSVTYKKALMEDEDLKAILDKYAQMDTVGALTPVQS